MLSDSSKPLNILFIGSNSIGKTCLIHRMTGKIFTQTIPTVSIDFSLKKVELDGLKINIQLLDTPGQVKYQHRIADYYRKASFFVIVFDLTNQKSFDDIGKTWLKKSLKYGGENIPKVLLGNKSDLKAEKVVDQQKIEEFAKKVKIPYFEVSAKTGNKIEDALLNIARRAIKPSLPSKIIVVGDSLSGKSYLIYRLVEDKFLSKGPPIYGPDYVQTRFLVDNCELKFEVWDTPGEEEVIREETEKRFYKNALGIVIVLDLTKQRSFDDMKKWLEEIKNKRGEKVCRIILGNKMDLKEERVIDKQMIRELIEEIKISYFEVSAKTGENVEEAFYCLARDIKRNLLDDDTNSQASSYQKGISLSFLNSVLCSVFMIFFVLVFWKYKNTFV